MGEGTAVFENLRTYMASLQIIASLKPSVIYPGHGPVINEPMRAITEYINHRMKREQEILSALPANAQDAIDVNAIVDKVYQIPDILKLAAAANVSHHLEKLTEESRIKFDVVNNEKVYYKA